MILQNMKHIPFLLILGLFFIFQVGTLQSQELSTDSKKAKKAFELADRAFRIQEYQQAEFQYRNAVMEDPEFVEAWIMLGELYMETKQDTSAIAAYKIALTLDSNLYPTAYYNAGRLEYRNGLYEDALLHLESYLSFGRASQKAERDVLKWMDNCRFALHAMQNPVPFQPLNLGRSVNTQLNEYFPCLTADNQTLLFTRLLNDPNSFTGRQEDFFISVKGEGLWSPAKSIGPPINTIYNEGAPTLSADGKILIFTACESVNGYGEGREGHGRCDLFMSNWNGQQWSVPVNTGGPVNSSFWESQPSLAADGRSLYFVSNRNNNYDIWVARMDSQGRWSKPQELGEQINTPGYEGSVFIHPDNQTLYFSSDGHPGMGGMDLFYSRKDSTGKWGEPVNMGYPINTHKDENSILIGANGQIAMFASDRDEGFGGLDLYEFELYEAARPQYVTYLKGIVFDSESKEKLGADFELTDLETGEVAVRSFSNAGSGEFLVALPTNRDYALNVSKEGYLFYSENFSLSGGSSDADPFLKNIPLKKIRVGQSIVLRNIFFETDEYTLKESSQVELNKVVELLTANEDLTIEISGHTDNVGEQAYNLQLSENRSKSVYDYLLGKGILLERLVYKGYGESQPVDTNDNEAGRANNRRTELTVIDD